MNFLNTIIKPLKSIDAQKKQRNINRSMLELLYASILMSLGLMLTMFVFGLETKTIIITGISSIIAIFLIGCFKAFLLQKIIWIITEKAKYADTLTAISKSAVIFSATLFGALILINIPIIGIILAVPLLILGVAIAYAVCIKALQTYTGADIRTIFIALIIMFIAILASAYVLGTLSLLNTGTITTTI